MEIVGTCIKRCAGANYLTWLSSPRLGAVFGGTRFARHKLAKIEVHKHSSVAVGLAAARTMRLMQRGRRVVGDQNSAMAKLLCLLNGFAQSNDFCVASAQGFCRFEVVHLGYAKILIVFQRFTPNLFWARDVFKRTVTS